MGNTSYVVDTSFWISLFKIDDQNHQLALSIVKEKGLRKSDIYTHICLIEELFTVLVLKYRLFLPSRLHELMEKVFDDGIVPLNEKSLIKSYAYLNDKISFADMVGVILALHTESELITFDHQQERLRKLHQKN